MSSVRSSSPAPSASSLNKEKLQWKVNGEWNEHYFKSIFQHALLYLAETKQGAFPKVGPSFWDKVQMEFCRDKSLVAVSSQNFYKQVTRYTTEVTKYLGLSENGDIGNLSREGGAVRSDYKAFMNFAKERSRLESVASAIKADKQEYSDRIIESQNTVLDSAERKKLKDGRRLKPAVEIDGEERRQSANSRAPYAYGTLSGGVRGGNNPIGFNYNFIDQIIASASGINMMGHNSYGSTKNKDLKLLTEGSFKPTLDDLLDGASVTNQKDRITLASMEKFINNIILGFVYKDGDLVPHEDFAKSFDSLGVTRCSSLMLYYYVKGKHDSLQRSNRSASNELASQEAPVDVALQVDEMNEIDERHIDGILNEETLVHQHQDAMTSMLADNDNQHQDAMTSMLADDDNQHQDAMTSMLADDDKSDNGDDDHGVTVNRESDSSSDEEPLPSRKKGRAKKGLVIIRSSKRTKLPAIDPDLSYLCECGCGREYDGCRMVICRGCKGCAVCRDCTKQWLCNECQD